jgi:hypothetical protein
MKPENRAFEGMDEDRDFDTDYRKNFKSHPNARQKAFEYQVNAPSTLFVAGEPFTGRSTHQEDFPRWHTNPPKSFKPGVSSIAPDKEDRDFLTEHGHRYNPKGNVARKPVLPFKSHVFDVDDDRTFETESRKNFAPIPENYYATLKPNCPSKEIIRKNPETQVLRGHKMFHHELTSNGIHPIHPLTGNAHPSAVSYY